MGWEREPAKATGPLGKVHSQSSKAGWGSPVCHHPQEDTEPWCRVRTHKGRGREPGVVQGASTVLQQRGPSPYPHRTPIWNALLTLLPAFFILITLCSSAPT